MSANAAPLSTSTFVAALSSREKSPWRFAATLLGGLVGGFAVALLVGGLVLAAYAFAPSGLHPSLAAALKRAASLLSGPGSDAVSSLMLMALAVATNGPWALVIVGVAAIVAGRPMLAYLTAAPAFRWKLMMCGLLLSFLVVGPFVAATQLVDLHAPTPPVFAISRDLGARLGYAVACVLLLTPAAAAEEAVFRGWLLRQSAAVSRNPVFLMVVNGVLFSAVHGEFAPEPFLTRAVMGAGFVYMTLRLGGIEFSTGAHAANNILLVLFVQPLSLHASPSAGSVSIAALSQDAFLFFSYMVITETVARWAALRHWTGAGLAIGTQWGTDGSAGA